MKKIIKNNKDIFRQNDKNQVYEYFKVSENIWRNNYTGTAHDILIELTDMMIDAFNCSIVLDTLVKIFMSYQPQGCTNLTFSKYISKRLINETILLSTLLSSLNMYNINSLKGMTYSYGVLNQKKSNALIYFVKNYATIEKNTTFDDKILENMENIIGNISRIENEIIKNNKKGSRYIRSNIAIIKELQSDIYVAIIDKFKYVATQNIWDKCFSCNNSGLFKAISKNGCTTNIKFTSEHIKCACLNLSVDMVKFLLDQRILPSSVDMQVLMLSQNSASSEILEIISSYTKNIPHDIKVITELVKSNKDNITSDVIDILKLTSDDLKEMRRKFYLKSSYSKLETKNSVLLLQKLFLFDTLENIQKYIKLHGTQGDLICCECALLNIDPNVMIYALDTYGYQPSIMHITKINDYLKRMYLINKYYPELNKLNEYKAQVLKQTTQVPEPDNIKKSTINKKQKKWLMMK
jgi:hypothetical protein